MWEDVILRHRSDRRYTDHDYACFLLGTIYLMVAVVTAVHLIRIKQVDQSAGWTRQKSFLLLVFLVNTGRMCYFILNPSLTDEDAAVHVEDRFQFVAFYILHDLPLLVMFLTFTMLIVFWTVLHDHAVGTSSSVFVQTFLMWLNASVVVTFGILWILMVALSDSSAEHIVTVSGIILSALYLLIAVGFALYGLRLRFIRLRSVQAILSRKFREAGAVAVVFTVMFLTRSVLVFVSYRITTLSLTSVTLVLYYCGVEILPCSLLIYVLRELPARYQSDTCLLQPRQSSVGSRNSSIASSF
eukprot:Rmarinus@m.23197